MNSVISSASKVSLTLIAPHAGSNLAAGILSRHLNLPQAEAMARLNSAPSILADAIPHAMGQDLQTLLRALGLKVRLDHPVAQHRQDMSLQLKLGARTDRTIRVVATALGLPMDSVAADLNRPGGILLPGLSDDEVTDLTAKLRRGRGLLMLLSDPETATYDIFPTISLQPQPAAILSHHLRILGVTGDPLTGAIASGLDHRMRSHLLAHFEGLGLIAIDRSFQRYDLDLVSVSGWVTSDLADFLMARTSVPRARFEVISPDCPLRIELALPHTAARQFRADYAALGLGTRLVLRGLAEISDNPTG